MRRDNKPQPEIVEHISLLNNGKLFTELDQKFRALNLACLETGGKGKITLTVSVERSGHNMVMVTPELKITEPLPPKKTNSFFVLSDGRASRQDPDQEVLPFADLRLDES